MHRKRKAPHVTDTSKALKQISSKRRKTRDWKSQELVDWIQPAEFWDSLSSIPLTRAALQEQESRFIKVEKPIEIRKQKKTRWSKQYLPKVPARIARHGGLDLTDLRGYPNPLEMPAIKKSKVRKKPNQRSSTSGTTRQSKTTSKRSGPYDRAFSVNLADHNIFHDQYVFPNGELPPEPENLKEIQQRALQRRNSLSPPWPASEVYKRFRKVNSNASKEKQVSETVLPFLEGTIEDNRARSGGIRFANLKPLIAENTVPGNPDIYYGARPEQIRVDIREALKDLILPTTEQDLPALPNFMLAVKGPNGTPAVSGRQALYDGSIAARGIHSLRCFRDEETYDGNAYCISSVYQDGQLKMYTVHLVKTDSGSVQYIMTLINAWSLTGNAEVFQEGVSAFRNLRDWCKEQRDVVIEIANAKTV